jgi:hypothetical protein
LGGLWKREPVLVIVRTFPQYTTPPPLKKLPMIQDKNRSKVKLPMPIRDYTGTLIALSRKINSYKLKENVSIMVILRSFNL